MHGYLPRLAAAALARALGRSPAGLLVGPRQCGKSTLARQLLSQGGDGVLLDLQDRGDRAKLVEPELFFEAHRHELVCLDEIQLLPEFIGLLRAEIDRDRRPGGFLLLGSASGPLLRQSHESLAGRVAELDLVLERGQRRRVYEIKLSKAPKVSRGFHELVAELAPERAELIAPVDSSFQARAGIWVRPALEASQAATAA